MLTNKHNELLCFIHRKLEETGVSPSFEEMKEALDLKSKSGIHRVINALEERQFIRRLPNRSRAREVVKLPEGMERTRTPIAADTIPKTVAPPIPMAANDVVDIPLHGRSEEHTSELQSLMRISYAVFCLKKKKQLTIIDTYNIT